ncbi:MAG: AAA family ATPase [Clostridia bacterium]|nr:AAA family ATPase [Clostridia bacterium]
MPEITKIAITGGPCGGKSTALCQIQSAFTDMGYTVLFVPETATELIDGGVTPKNCPVFQKTLLTLQIEKEKAFFNAASAMDAEKVLIVCDRGAMDNKAYMSDSEFNEILTTLNTSEVELRDGYDAVFHLVTAAKGAKEFYTNENNPARTEDENEAAEIDDKLIAAWTGHPHFRVIDNSSEFEDKIKRLIKEISSFLGEPEPFETERKFLIERPDVEALEALPNCRKVEIIQTYLKSDNGDEVRVRQRGERGNYIYFQTIKRSVTPLKRVEIEKRLSQNEYLERLMDADTTKHPIRKNRYCLTYNNLYFEIDIFPSWDDEALCEIELCDENEEIVFPDFIRIIKEVTDDDRYKNASLAERI